MAPQIGPKDAPTIWKKGTRLPATRVMAREAPTVTATRVETPRGILGSMVPRLLAMMNVQKQVGATEAAAKTKKVTEARLPTLEIAAVNEYSAGLDAVPIWPMWPATARRGRPPATTMASA